MVKKAIDIDELRRKPFMDVKTLSEVMGMGMTYLYDYIKGQNCQFNVVKMGKRYINSYKQFFQLV
ncbi:MAG: hypothetical protein K6G42_10755 [Lachnospiraceae bacterium]|nr:hypothetical protein [Lachnospiraceae bacterium]